MKVSSTVFEKNGLQSKDQERKQTAPLERQKKR